MKTRVKVSLLCWLLGCGLPLGTLAETANVLRGRELIDSERCMECHGEDGQGPAQGDATQAHFAKLAGQRPQYILKQMQDFRSGARKHDLMAIMARSVNDEDLREIAAYFASLGPMKADPARSSPAGKRLYEQGRGAAGVPTCLACHGEHGRGVPGQPLIPVIGGQAWRYLDKQLRDWRSGERRNSSDGLMTEAARSLTDADIEALASHLSGL